MYVYYSALRCDSCGNIKAVRKHKLLRSPPLLIITLKRFAWDSATKSATKLDCRVDFPFILRLGQFFHGNSSCDSMCPYILRGVIRHMGGLSSGHYTTISRYGEANSKHWLVFDDHRVSNVSEDKVVSSSAYVLLFESKVWILMALELLRIAFLGVSH